MIEDMAQLHMTEAELARDLHAVLEQVRQGTEVIVERDAKPVAVIKAPQFRGRPIDECIALAKAHGSHATLDEDFGKDLEDIINSHREPLNPPAWD
jgi:antitoxin (DNA-binding transcriptional repressor) of toxin-antitoxin stability system